MPAIPLTWPPSLASYKVDLKLAADDDRWDDALQASLDAAVAYVEEARPDVDFYGESGHEGSPVTMRIVLGALRYARRLDVRRESPLATVLAGDLGAANLSALDADIDRLLRLGRWARIRFA